jgi:hypothetical protein
VDIDRFNRLMVALVLAIILSAILSLGQLDALAAGLQELYVE